MSTTCFSRCPACNHNVATLFLEGGLQPLATIAWPESPEAAQEMKRLPNDFVRCVECGHVFNPAFDYAEVPYQSKPNLMFNRGLLWSKFLDQLAQRLAGSIAPGQTVVEIGHGDGSFLAALAAAAPGVRFVGFDPNGAAGGSESIELRTMLFNPEVHLAELRPSLLISRHVLEHLTNPLAFLQQISFCARQAGISPTAYFEVPCIDRALTTHRTVDFYYEHNSHFTTRSFAAMVARCGAHTVEIGHAYDGEVLYGKLGLGASVGAMATADETEAYRLATRASRYLIGEQLEALRQEGHRILLWGGTGKSAAFINRHHLDAVRFPHVVDSDAAKAGTCVPGTGQTIQSADELRNGDFDVVVIPPQWRAADILLEANQRGVQFMTVLIEHDGQLVDYRRDLHPYRKVEIPSPVAA